MAKITVAGDSLVITSAMTLDQIKTLEKYNPKALKLVEKDEDGVKATVFEVASTNLDGTIGPLGAYFGSETRDEKKLAVITLPISKTVADAKEYAADKYGVAIMRLNQIEASFAAALEAVNENKKKILENITVM